MGSLQALLEEQLSTIPRVIAIELVRDKLKASGHAEDEKLIGSIVDQLLGAGSGTDADGDNEDVIEIESDEDIVLQFTDADTARVQDYADKISETLPDLIHTVAEAAAGKMLRRYERDWAVWRAATDIQMDQFRFNLQARWGKGFDALRMLIELSRDIGTDFHRRASRSRSRRRAHLNKALFHLHVRAIQIASEIMVLMENGYADGAMARWRTLHEVACVAMVLDDGGEVLAERYLAHEIVEAKKGLGQYQQCHTRLGYAPIAKRAAARIEKDYADATHRYGKEFGGDYGWVAAHLGNPKPNFSNIEDAAGRAMMRSHYKMASHNVHASTKGIAYRLGSLDRRYAVVAGASNVGFVEPGQNLALSLLHIAMLLLPTSWTLDKIVQLITLNKLHDRIPRALAQAERAIARDEKKIREAAVARHVSAHAQSANRDRRATVRLASSVRSGS
ncbi:DUF5677 domain-containing protein [Mesorhizobium sp. B2-8-5]|uniref:DUF5677 domain-containing protein n=1 Tax=Mesorhizobium sp. B2-8-5 TaxID=2589903 RepID=UPI00112D5099|nr:DUF5677 domain-containing protein [Mesorhizobium sp. B2-8-5]UCI23985.1 DUF5677 domain-containing protein [Mesorhizobium sp. B2-8-5]